MDVQPPAPNGRAVVLLHGKNFCAATWEDTITVLAEAGFRVVAPHQIGFCKSTKPRTTSTPSRSSPEIRARCLLRSE
jgi:pimeloyl-ACP methyl ester carboxylesterase